MRLLRIALAVVLIASMASSGRAGITVSLGVRETGGGIEWIDLDGQSFAFDGNWHTLTWALDGTKVTGFAGASANGILEGTSGTLENLRFLNSDSITAPISIYIDDIVSTTPGGSTSVTDFEGYTVGQAVMFRDPSFSGSTAGNLVKSADGGPDAARISTDSAQSGTGSLKAEFQFLDGTPSRWLRLTTSNTATLGNPAIPFGAGTSLSVSFRAVPEPSSLGLLGFAAIGLLRRRRR